MDIKPLKPGIVVNDKTEIKEVGKGHISQAILLEILNYLGYKEIPADFVSKQITVLPAYSKDGVELKTSFSYIYFPPLRFSVGMEIVVDKEIRRAGVATAMADYYVADLKKAGIETAYGYTYFSETHPGYLFLLNRKYSPVTKINNRTWLRKEVK